VGELEVEMTFVADVLESITSAFCALAPERGIQFEVIQDSSELPGVMAAPKALQEAISNILDNAFKYVLLPRDGSPFSKNPSPHVRLRMMSNRGGEPGVIIVVEDNGPGICEGDYEAIFQRGFRAEKTSDLPGSGIGLDISRTLVEGMGGSLEVAHPKEFKNALNGAILKCTLLRRRATKR
jgi:signal transduction histidine kinase